MKHVLQLSICLSLLAIMLVGAVQADESTLLPGFEEGPYEIGITTLTFADTVRPNNEVSAEIWYPAIIPEGERARRTGLRDAEPVSDSAPYPVVIYSHRWLGSYGESVFALNLLVSNGYVVVSPHHQDSEEPTHEYVDRPLDVKMILDGLFAATDEPLVDIMDLDKIGMIGFDQGASATLQMIGLLTNFNQYENWCTENAIETRDCGYIPIEEINAYRAQLGLENTAEGNWVPFTDERIDAVVALGACGFPLTDDASLAQVEVPIMLMHAKYESICDFEGNAARTWAMISSPDRYLMVKRNRAESHSLLVDARDVRLQFIVPFFNLYLKDDVSMAEYLTEEFALSFERSYLGWGIDSE